jgi:hypothetical protein
MRGRNKWLAGLVAVGLTLAPAVARAQDGKEWPEGGQVPDALTVRAQTPDGELPDYELPVPLGHNPANKGGFFIGAEFVYFRQTNPLHDQIIAYRGLIDADGSVTGVPGTWVGSQIPALNAKDAGGPGTYQPGLRTTLGYAFKDGTSIDVQWMWLAKATYMHEATIVAPNFQFGVNLADSFITAPVFNFTNAFAGPQSKLPPSIGDATATYGIWDGADIMTISFMQRTESLQARLKTPIFYNDDFGYRMYALTGPRFFWIWERFYWRTVNENPDGTADPTQVAIFTNIVSNRMYGWFCGCGNEWYIGHGLACNLDLEAAGLLDVVKERAKYELGDKFIPGQIKRAKTDYTAVPEFAATFNLTWFPLENVEFKLGYDMMAFFNTIAAQQPVSFNVGGLDPPWVRQFRWFDGFQFGLGIMF